MWLSVQTGIQRSMYVAWPRLENYLPMLARCLVHGYMLKIIGGGIGWRKLGRAGQS